MRRSAGLLLLASLPALAAGEFVVEDVAFNPAFVGGRTYRCHVARAGDRCTDPVSEGYCLDCAEVNISPWPEYDPDSSWCNGLGKLTKNCKAMCVAGCNWDPNAGGSMVAADIEAKGGTGEFTCVCHCVDVLGSWSLKDTCKKFPTPELPECSPGNCDATCEEYPTCVVNCEAHPCQQGCPEYPDCLDSTCTGNDCPEWCQDYPNCPE